VTDPFTLGLLGESYYVDRAGHPITLVEWAALQGTDYRWVARTRWRRYHISTIWLGMNLPFASQIYESMIFYRHKHRRGIGIDVEQVRYATETVAVQGHRDLVNRVRNGAYSPPCAPERDEHYARQREWGLRR
jgi:hypothetical protein